MFLYTVENISKLDDLKYSETIPPNHQEKLGRMDNEDFLFKDFDYKSFEEMKPPKNSSLQTYYELEYLSSLPEDVEMVKYFDDIKEVFKQGCMENGIEYPKELVKKLKKDASAIILKLKYFHNRPRPFQLAKIYGMKLSSVQMESMHTPSYPSGHSTQGFLIAHVLSTKYNIKNDSFYNLAEKISLSRNVARAHYPSDSKLGRELGKKLYKHIIHKI
jgi:hypothetical protein